MHKQTVPLPSSFTFFLHNLRTMYSLLILFLTYSAHLQTKTLTGSIWWQSKLTEIYCLPPKHLRGNPSFPKPTVKVKQYIHRKAPAWFGGDSVPMNGHILKRQQSHLSQKLDNSARLWSKGCLKHRSSFPPPPPLPQHNTPDSKLQLIFCQHGPEICSVPLFKI